jgi:hypothetical protein
MAKASKPYATVLASFWPDTGAWTDDERICALYLLTCSHRKTEGLFRLPAAYADEDLRWEPGRFTAAVELLTERGWLMRDGAWILLVKSLRIEQNQPKGRPRIIGARNAVENAPRESPLYRRFYEEAARYCPDLHEALDPPSEGSHEGVSRRSADPSEYSTSTSTSNSNSTSKPASRAGAHEAPAAPADGQAGTVPLASVWGQQVRPLLEQVTEWDGWMSRGGDAAVFAVMQGRPGLPWQQIAAHAVSDRHAGTLTTDDPRTALRLKADDHEKRTADPRIITDPGTADRAAAYGAIAAERRHREPPPLDDTMELTA